jgi:anti-sigma B factor antagonist
MTSSDGQYAVQITVSAEGHNGAVVVAVAGEVDLLTAPELEQALLTTLDKRPPVLVIDLTEVGFLASAGLGVLVKVYSAVDQQRTKLRVVASSREARRPLQVTGLLEILAVYATREEALNEN